MSFERASIGLVALASCALWHIQAFSPSQYTGGLQPLARGAAVASSQISSVPRQRSCWKILRMAADDDDDDEDEEDQDPLAKGIDSVSWLPSVIKQTAVVSITNIPKDAEVLPLFPLGGIVYTPNSEHVLNIFEPRYRQMYNDILMTGAKRFVVSMSHPLENGRFAQTGVLFELLDLKEVSEQTQDQIKYICSHRVTGRVKIHRILNPEVWSSKETYLRVEGTIEFDGEPKKEDDKSTDIYGALSSAMEGTPQEEKALRKAFADLVEIQHEMEEDVRFTRASVLTLATKPGAGENGLWQTVRLWQSFVDQRLVARQNELQRDFQEKLQNFLKKEKGLKDNELPSAIGFSDLTPALQNEVKEVQKRMAVELQPLVLESTLTMQKILEAKDHTARLKLMRHFITAETKRLTTKKAIKGMFPDKAKEEPSARGSDENVSGSQKKTDSNPSSSSIFTDEPDAFQ